MALTMDERVRRATAARVSKARVRRFQRYLREMRETGLHVKVSDASIGELYAYNDDPAAFPVPH